MRSLTIIAILAACDPEIEVDDRDFKPAPSPATCLVIEEVLYTPSSGPSLGWQWVNVYNRCSSTVKLANTEIRWTRPGFGWANKMLLSDLVALQAWGCITVGGPKSAPSNASPEYDLAKPFVPAIADPAQLGTAAGVGLFVAGSKLPFAAVIFGGENLEAIVGVGGDIDLVTDIDTVAKGHSMRLYAGRWIDGIFPEPEHCGIY